LEVGKWLGSTELSLELWRDETDDPKLDVISTEIEKVFLHETSLQNLT
jgi:hypothetical protein